jgi:hypothetical protein
MLMQYLSTSDYFSNYLEWNTEQTILDFGSNCGNLLLSNKIINDNQYTGIDVYKKAIDIGGRLRPNANWIWYNRFNPVYNPTGDKVLPKIDKKFDMIISYSVFTHTTAYDMVEMIEHLFTYLKDGGSIYFTYCNIKNKPLVNWFRNRRSPTCDEVPDDKDFVYLTDDRITTDYPSEKCIHFVSFYNEEWLTRLLSKFNPISYAPPGGKWLQDCMVLTKK